MPARRNEHYHRIRQMILPLFFAFFLPGAPLAGADESSGTRKVVLIAGKKSHGPEGNRIHDYPWSVRLLKVMLDNSNIRDRLAVEFHLDGWPEDQRTLEDADTIMIISDGRDGDLYEEAPHLKSQARVNFMALQMKRGCGFMTFHFSTFAPDRYAAQMLDWNGGYFDWETDGKRKWYSAIRTIEADVEPGSPGRGESGQGAAGHPVLRGVKPFRMKEEFYYNIRFRPGDETLEPIWVVPALPGRKPDGRIVAWARQRPGGGRGFGTTAGHFYDNWKHDSFRKMILNAIAWTARIDVPGGGVESRFFTRDEIRGALAGVEVTGRALVEPPIRALILTGHNYPGHRWKETTPVIRAALEQDPRISVSVSTDIEDLARRKLTDHDVLILNYCNWKQPAGLSEAGRRVFVNYLSEGGGLVLVHFANGAWHFSLPDAGASDWPEFRRICRRVWDHTSDSGHDPYGRFTVRTTGVKHPITDGMKDFKTTDELYFRQKGQEPIVPLVTARSGVTGKDEPLAWAYRYGKGRVFQTVLGHDAPSLRHGGVAQLVRRGSVWAAARAQRKIGRRAVPPHVGAKKSARVERDDRADLRVDAGRNGAKKNILPPGPDLDGEITRLFRSPRSRTRRCSVTRCDGRTRCPGDRP